jgi:hypothetical protein
MLHATLQTPLPGDLVIRESEDASGMRPVAVFVISVWPHGDESAGLHLTYAYALRQARAMAVERGVSVWRELEFAQNRIEFDNVTED